MEMDPGGRLARAPGSCAVGEQHADEILRPVAGTAEPDIGDAHRRLVQRMKRALQRLALGVARRGLNIEQVLVHRHDLPRTLYPIEDGRAASRLRRPSPAASGTQYLPAAVAGARRKSGTAPERDPVLLLLAGPAGEALALQRLAGGGCAVLVAEAAEAGAVELAVVAGDGHGERGCAGERLAALV